MNKRIREEQVHLNLSFSIVESIDVLIKFRELCESSDEHYVTGSVYNILRSEYIFTNIHDACRKTDAGDAGKLAFPCVSECCAAI